MNATQAPMPYSLDDLFQKLGIELKPKQTSNKPSQQQNRVGGVNLSIPQLMDRSCVDGERTQHLTKLAGALFAKGFTLQECTEMCMQWNARNVDPLDDGKVESTCASIHLSDVRNHPERHASALNTTPFLSLADGRIDRYLVTRPPAHRWLLDNLIVLGKAAAIVAPGGSSKSQLLLQLAVGVATGIAVADHWQVGESGGVLVFSAEDDADEIHRRIRRITDHLHLEGHGPSLKGIEDKLYVFSTVGRDMLLTRRQLNGEVTGTRTVGQVLDLAKQIPDLKLIIADPASRFRGGDENKNEDATRFVEALETLAKATGATVMIAHHTNKGSYQNENGPGQGASRGASALTDGLRFQMSLGPPGEKQLKSIGVSKDEAGRYVVATVTKTNYSAFPTPVVLERLPGGYLAAVTPAQCHLREQNAALGSLLAAVSSLRKPSTARQIETQFGGVNKPLKLPLHDLRGLLKVAIQRGLLQGVERKPLAVTQLGQDFLAIRGAREEDAR